MITWPVGLSAQVIPTVREATGLLFLLEEIPNVRCGFHANSRVDNDEKEDGRWMVRCLSNKYSRPCFCYYPKGKLQARCAGHLLMRDGYSFDVGFCSMMSRDLSTLCHLSQEMEDITDVKQNWCLNPRAMGAFTGQKIGTLDAKYGINNVDNAFITYKGAPPRMTRHHMFYELIRNDGRYERVLSKQDFPLRESHERVQKRVVPYWIDVIGTQIKLNKKSVVVADDTVLRVLIQYLDNLSNFDTMKLKIRKATPFVYTLDHNLRPIRGKSMQYLDNLVPIKLSKRDINCPDSTY